MANRMSKKSRGKDQEKKRKSRKDKDPKEKRPQRTVENSRLPVEVLPEDSTLAEDIFSFFADGNEPKILITTSRVASKDTCAFADELADLFPTSEFRKRSSEHLLKDIVIGAIERQYTHLIVVNDSRKVPDTLSVIKLPEGPTALFKLSSIKLSREIHNHGRSSSHIPELVLNNFSTRLGNTLGRLFISLFPHVPQFNGRQVVTLHNQRDFIFARRHRYIFEEGKRVRMQEIGPQFTLKLRKMYRAMYDFSADAFYTWKSHGITSKQFII